MPKKLPGELEAEFHRQRTDYLARRRWLFVEAKRLDEIWAAAISGIADMPAAIQKERLKTFALELSKPIKAV